MKSELSRPPQDLRRVRDFYGNTCYVEASQLASDCARLRLYRFDGTRVMTKFGPSPVDWIGAVLPRGSICPHGDDCWEIRRFPNGETYQTCRECERAIQ